MKPERFKRTKSVVAGTAIALVVAALVIGLSSLVLGPRSASPQAPGFDLTSNPSSFTISSTIYASPACSGSPALLYPGTTRCAVFSVHNLLNVPITVQSISSALDSSFPAPPANCAPPTYFTLPSFSGSATVLAGATTALPGVTIMLLESGNSQDACENFTYHFTYTGSAQYTDSTSTTLTSTPNPSTPGQSVTFKATVTAANPSTDANPPSGTVSFYKCTSATVCPNTSTNLLGSGTISGGVANFSTTSLPVGTTYVEAVYPASGTDFTGSTSGVVAQVVNSTGVGTTSVLTSAPNPSNLGSSVTFTDKVSATSGTPTGTVTFYSCTSNTCSTKTSLGSGTLSAGKATVSTSALPVGTTYVEAIYAGSGNFGGSTSGVVAQVVNAFSTTSVLSASPNPSSFGSSVSFTDKVSASSGTPSGTVTFYSCTTNACSTKTSLGAQTLVSGKATYSTSALPVGTTYVEAIYAGSGNYGGSTSNVVAQVVKAISTTTALTSSPDPSALGQSVTLSATVAKSSGTSTPTGTVTFHLGSPTGTVVGTGTLNSSGQASATTSSLPAGADNLYAVYAGDTHFSGSTSLLLVQVVIALPAKCTGSYPNFFYGDPHFPFINGTNQGDFVYALGADFLINGFNGNDCLVVGDGNNLITDGNGNDVVTAGNGDNLIALGNGNDSATTGNGSGEVAVGNGTDTISVGNGSHNQVLVGNGNDTISVGTGTSNTITLGSGIDTVTLASPSALSSIHDTIYGGANAETIYLGAGSYSTYVGVKGKANTCHLPKPPSSWHGTVADYYHDTITNCTVVTP